MNHVLGHYQVVRLQEIPDPIQVINMRSICFLSDSKYFGWDDAENLYEQEDVTFILLTKKKEKQVADESQIAPPLAGRIIQAREPSSSSVQAASTLAFFKDN